jgi:RNA polymerase sigma factor (TIGR02999 family)
MPDDDSQISRDWIPRQAALSDHTFENIYNDLRRLAAARMKSERAGVTLQATSLVHEAFIRLSNSATPVEVRDRAHFKALASRAMRHVLTDRARERSALKRGNDPDRVEFTDAAVPGGSLSYDVLALHEALQSLEKADLSAARVVELKFFGGCTDEEVVAVTEQSLSTVRRHWAFARAWLAARLQDSSPRM